MSDPQIDPQVLSEMASFRESQTLAERAAAERRRRREKRAKVQWAVFAAVVAVLGAWLRWRWG